MTRPNTYRKDARRADGQFVAVCRSTREPNGRRAQMTTPGAPRPRPDPVELKVRTEDIHRLLARQLDAATAAMPR